MTTRVRLDREEYVALLALVNGMVRSIVLEEGSYVSYYYYEALHGLRTRLAGRLLRVGAKNAVSLGEVEAMAFLEVAADLQAQLGPYEALIVGKVYAAVMEGVRERVRTLHVASRTAERLMWD